jgi:hypothetical protein
MKGPGGLKGADQIIATVNNRDRNALQFMGIGQELTWLDPGIVQKIVIL